MKMTCFLCPWLFVCPRACFSDFLIEFCFVILEGRILFVLLELFLVSFEFPFFRKYLRFVYSICIVNIIFFLSFHSMVSLSIFFCSTFVCSRSFFIHPASLISLPDFFFFGFLKEITILLLTSFSLT